MSLVAGRTSLLSTTAMAIAPPAPLPPPVSHPAVSHPPIRTTACNESCLGLKRLCLKPVDVPIVLADRWLWLRLTAAHGEPWRRLSRECRGTPSDHFAACQDPRA